MYALSETSLLGLSGATQHLRLQGPKHYRSWAEWREPVGGEVTYLHTVNLRSRHHQHSRCLSISSVYRAAGCRPRHPVTFSHLRSFHLDVKPRGRSSVLVFAAGTFLFSCPPALCESLCFVVCWTGCLYDYVLTNNTPDSLVLSFVSFPTCSSTWPLRPTRHIVLHRLQEPKRSPGLSGEGGHFRTFSGKGSSHWGRGWDKPRFQVPSDVHGEALK